MGNFAMLTSGFSFPDLVGDFECFNLQKCIFLAFSRPYHWQIKLLITHTLLSAILFLIYNKLGQV